MRLDEWMNKNEVAERYQVTPETVTRWVAAGAFPLPCKIGAGSFRWPKTTLEFYENEVRKLAEQKAKELPV